MTDGGARRFSAGLSVTPLADEYRRIEAAFSPAPSRASLDLASHSADAIGKARTWWLAMMSTEYASSSTFVDLALQLRAIDDPLDVQAVTLRMAQDELRHAAICARVIEALGAEPTIAAPPLRRAQPHTDCGPEEAALRTVIFGCCLSETVNAARLAKYFAETRDPFVRDAFRLLLADERLHAQFGFYYLESKRAWLEARPEVVRSLGRYLRFAFAALEQYMGAVPLDARPLTDDERAIGLPDLTTLSETFQETILNASIPGLERFGIDAAAAWRERSTTAPPKRKG
jgi:hypothetical protein